MRSLTLRRTLLLAATVSMIGCASSTAPPAEEIPLWPGAPPGTEDWTGPEEFKEGSGEFGTIHVKSNVSVPAMTLFRPRAGKASGTAMLVLPGGAFSMLVWDLEGTEVAQWLAERGITAFVLKYRVHALTLAPGQKMPATLASLRPLMEPRRGFAVADAIQAMRMLRENAAQYHIDPHRIGMMGFSAGAIATLGVVLESDAEARPDFAAPIYGAPMIEPKVPADAPPLFLVHAQDDPTVPVSGSTQMFDLWTAAKRPAELHIYAKGNHGFGMRAKNLPVGHWPDAFEAWLDAQGLLKREAPR